MGVVVNFSDGKTRVPPEPPKRVCAVTIKWIAAQEFWLVTIKEPRDWQKPLEFPLYVPDYLYSAHIVGLELRYRKENIEMIVEGDIPLELFGFPPEWTTTKKTAAP